MKHIGLPALARNCNSLEELEQATTEWWERYHRISGSLKYSASCVSDQEYCSEALRHWQDCSRLLAASKRKEAHIKKEFSQHLRNASK